MVETKSGVSFDDIIQADRQRKKNEALASEIFGRGKQNKDAGGNNRNSPRTQGFASRVGITKRSSSTASTGSQSGNPFSPPLRPSSATAQRVRANRIASAVNSQNANIIPSEPKSSGPGLSIKGKAGPFIVEASNFAPGTTAEDIESSLANETVDSEGRNGMTSCRIVVNNPTVIAEMIFSERQVADRVISTYNNQRADGRVLHLYLKQLGAGGPPLLRSRKSEPPSSTVLRPIADSKELVPENNNGDIMDDVEMSTENAPVVEVTKDTANRERRDRESRRAEPEVQDGRFGFNDQQQQDPEPRSRDNVASQGRAEDREQGRHRDRDRERDRDRDRDRERRYDDNRYDRRNDHHRGGFRRDERPEERDNRPGRPAHHGNGVGGPGSRGSFGGTPPMRGGRMYSDDVMRGGRGGQRGGYWGYR